MADTIKSLKAELAGVRQLRAEEQQAAADNEKHIKAQVKERADQVEELTDEHKRTLDRWRGSWKTNYEAYEWARRAANSWQDIIESHNKLVDDFNWYHHRYGDRPSQEAKRRARVKERYRKADFRARQKEVKAQMAKLKQHPMST